MEHEDRVALKTSLLREAGAYKLSYTVPQFCSASGLGKTSIYEAIKSGELKSVFVAGRRLILHEDGEAWLKSGRDAA